MKKMKSVMLSIKPKWCELIASGKKTIEVRKTRPKIETPLKVLICCTIGGGDLYSVNGKVQKINEIEIDLTKDAVIEQINGKVIGEFVCDEIYDMRDIPQNPTCITIEEWLKYTEGYKGVVYAWHISDLVIYDKPKELSEFSRVNVKCKLKDGYIFATPEKELFKLKRPPQSWCYVEELK